LTVGLAATQMTVSSITATASGGVQALTLNATVSSPNGPVNEGSVTFTVAGQTLTAAVHSGVAAAGLTLPAGFPTGHYSITASYADASNSNGLLNLAPSTAAGTLTVLQASAVTITQMTLTPGFGVVNEVVTAQVTSPTGPVNGGIVTFNIGGTQVQAAVSNGTATVSLTVPTGAALGPQGVGASYSNASGLVSSSAASRTAFLNPFSALLSGMVTLQPDGSEVVTVDFFGIQLTFIYNAAGVLTGAFFGSFPLLS
jgi:hypothetical protein